MIKVDSLIVEHIENGIRHVKAGLLADTKAEVVACGSSGANVRGLNPTDIMVLGSTAMCADGNYGMITSSGIWNW